MIKQLEKKFIWINMLLTGAILCIVLIALGTSNYNRLKSETVKSMMLAISRTMDGDKEKPQEIGRHPSGNNRPPDIYFIPVVIVKVIENGSYEIQDNSNATISDEILDTALEAAQLSDVEFGLLKDLSLRYMKKNIGFVEVFAFADISHERRFFQTMLLIGSAIFLISLFILFIISVFLAKWALKPVKKSWQQQRQFIADASHELKTPITVILANHNILLSHPEDTILMQKKWIENTQTEASRMKQLVDDLLYLAKSDAGKMPVLKNDFDFSDMLWSCILPFESVAFEQNISISENITPSIIIHGDMVKLKQLVIILLDNACKYAGNNGEVSITLGKENGKIVLSVHNDGTWIPEEDLEHIFERFYRSDKSRARKEGGYGLGLAIAKSIADSHDGKITARSSIDAGTSFILSLHA